MKKHSIKKSQHNIETVCVNIHSSMNNTIMNVTDLQGNVLTWSSGGKVKVKGARKGLPITASKVGYEIASFILESGVKSMQIKVHGIGYGRDNAIKAMQLNNVRVLSIEDVTPIAHNGCKPPKLSRK